MHSIESVDKVWLTCCALHNMLLTVDGLDKPWNGLDIPSSEYERRLGEIEFDDLPLPMQRLYNPEEVRQYDTLTIGITRQHAVNESEDGDESHSESELDVVRVVRNLSLHYFRERLVEHFDIQFKAGKIKWPRSRGQEPIV